MLKDIGLGLALKLWGLALKVDALALASLQDCGLDYITASRRGGGLTKLPPPPEGGHSDHISYGHGQHQSPADGLCEADEPWLLTCRPQTRKRHMKDNDTSEGTSATATFMPANCSFYLARLHALPGSPRIQHSTQPVQIITHVSGIPGPGIVNKKLSCRRGRAVLRVIEYFAKSLRSLKR